MGEGFGGGGKGDGWKGKKRMAEWKGGRMRDEG